MLCARAQGNTCMYVDLCVEDREIHNYLLEDISEHFIFIKFLPSGACLAFHCL